MLTNRVARRQVGRFHEFQFTGAESGQRKRTFFISVPLQNENIKELYNTDTFWFHFEA